MIGTEARKSNICSGNKVDRTADATHTQSLGGGQRSPVAGTKQRSSELGSQALVHDVLVNVEISSQHAMVKNDQPRPGHQSSDSNSLKKAQMVISIWVMENQRYFTLTFIPSPDFPFTSTPAHPRGMSQAEHQGALSGTSAPVLSSPTSPLGDPSCGPSSTKYAPFIALAPDLGAHSISHTNTPSTVLKTVNRMKDAMIDSMEIPVVAMCKDISLAIANKAASTLVHQETNSASTAPVDLLAKFKVYTEDFGRQLEPEEHPIVRICRSQKSFNKLKVGILDSKSQRKRFDVSGETIVDERTGEFLAGIIFMKDVTEYAEIITNQFEAGQQQFQLICDTIPQMVSFKWESDGVETFS